MREWQDLHEQLTEHRAALAAAHDMRRGVALRRCTRRCSTGFLGGIGVRDEGRTYLGARDTRFVDCAGDAARASGCRMDLVARAWSRRSPVRAHGGAGPAVVDRGCGARTWSSAATATRNGPSSAAWCSPAKPSSCTDACCTRGRWSTSPGRSATARRMFVEEALVRGRGGPARRIPANAMPRQLRAIESLEARLRRRDLLAGEEALVEFYLERIPRGVATCARLALVAEQEPGALICSTCRAIGCWHGRSLPLSPTGFPGSAGRRRQLARAEVRIRSAVPRTMASRSCCRCLCSPVLQSASRSRRLVPGHAARQGDRDPARAAEGAPTSARADSGRGRPIPGRRGRGARDSGLAVEAGGLRHGGVRHAGRRRRRLVRGAAAALAAA